MTTHDLKRGDYLVSTDDCDKGDLYQVVSRASEPHHYILKHVRSGLIDRSMAFYVGWNGTFREANASEIMSLNSSETLSRLNQSRSSSPASEIGPDVKEEK